MKNRLSTLIFLLSLQISLANTPAACNAPNIDSVSATSTTITVNWTNNNSDDPAAWRLSYYKSGELFVITIPDGAQRSYTITGLEPSTYYDAISIKANCYEDVYSDISNSKSIVTAEDTDCNSPTNFAITILGSQSAVLTWDNQVCYRWEVIYDLQGFDPAIAGTHVFTQNNNLYLTGFMVNQSYDFYIRTWCDEGTHSVWSSPLKADFVDDTALPGYSGPTEPDNCCNSYVPIAGKKYVISGWVKERHFTTHSVSEAFPINLLIKLYNEEIIAKVKDGTYNDFSQGYNPLEFPVYAPLKRHLNVAYPGIYNFSYTVTDGIVLNPTSATISFSFKENSGDTQSIHFYQDISLLGATDTTVMVTDLVMGGAEYTFSISNDAHIVIDTDGNLRYVSNSNEDTNHFFLIDAYLVEDYYQLPRYENCGIHVAIVDADGAPIVSGGNLGFFRPSGHVIEGWQRISGVFTVPQNVDINNNFAVELVNLNQDDTRVFFDDIRIVPYYGNIKSFVYDNTTKKLMAELDENNFATFYEYDKEGGLIRIKKETERGVYTIQETRSNTKK